ncbi:MAG: nickel-dependent lactate racemase [Acidobacteria bacterium]|nr:nickel-dependent lactate racemase [Acidobacteriota bacterium]MCA1637791.1 nickel-dependent lactate racemase [Acidobacteriota bacterium]
MPTINLGYGKSIINFTFDENKFDVLGETEPQTALSDVEIGEKLDNPIDSKTIEEIVQPNESVLIVVPDATRQTASGQIVNLLVRRLIANGTMPFDIRIIFATGIHRQVTEAEKKTILTPFIAQRIKTLNHNPRDLAQIVRLGETENKIPIELNRALTEHDHTIIVGGITFHYFAGFTGGRKLICPGLASSRTVSATHKLAFDCEKKSRREGVATANLDGNKVHEAFMEVAEKLPPVFSVNTITNDKDEAIDLFCGDWNKAHRKACDFYASQHTIKIKEKRDLVIVSCGGFPFDLNMIQAHKALETASRACKDGGKIIFLAECADGLGRKDFLSWFEAKNSEGLAGKLCESYRVNGQTAWSLLRKAERFNIQIITSLSEEETRPMRLQKVHSLDEALVKIDTRNKGYILPFGAKFLIKI